ncbi:Sigma-adaptin 3A [Coniosporium tulheliwenetii]|uniref:Sigma-adaptin 3A n=1 Tax=Coniosporium tulheliwenetii TaxID=3383036 RepID=A0ACC2ZP96_9PEZI|nr:Sigma-adaptin 3A [Cladosporium sp. JES 115]
MINAVLVFNNNGQPRLTKFYTQLDTSVQQRLISEIFTLVANRPNSSCNFLPPLALLDLIQVFVEALDRLFENVCELDLIFNFETLHATLSEMIVGGVVVETGLERVVEGVKAQGRVAKRPVNEGKGVWGLVGADWGVEVGFGLDGERRAGVTISAFLKPNRPEFHS